MRRVGGSFVLILAAAGTAEAKSLATAQLDVDGDGTADAISFDDAGVLHVGAAKVAVAKGATKGSLRGGPVANVPTIIVEYGAGDTSTAVVVEKRSTWKIVATTPVGPVGLDGEFSQAIELTPTAVQRYQVRPGYDRCDGAPSRLFLEALAGSAWKRVAPPVGVTNAATLAAKPDSLPAGTPIIFRAVATSHVAGATDALGLANPTELVDGQPTAWTESLPDHGEGQFFTFKSRVQDLPASQLRVIAGNAKASRPRALAIIGRKAAWRVELPDAPTTAHVVDLPAGAGDCITVVIESVYATKGAATEISELGVFAADERTGGGDALLARVIAQDSPNLQTVINSLRGPSAVVALEAELVKTTDAGARRRLVKALAHLGQPTAVPVLLRAITEGWVRGKDVDEAVAAIAAQQDVEAFKQLVGSKQLTLEQRVNVIRRITPTGKGLDLLVGIAGRGARELRRATIDRLSRAPSAELVVRAAAAERDSTAGDLWHAASVGLPSATAAERTETLAAMTAALPAAGDYERRYRLVEALARYGDAAALRLLSDTVRSYPHSAETVALRTVAVIAFGSNARPASAPYLFAATSDRDPGVRMASLFQIASAEALTNGAWQTAVNADGVDRVLINGLGDTWPEVRRRAASVLAPRCQRTGPAEALRSAVASDASIEVRYDALTSLTECRASGIGALLAQVWSNDKLPTPLRAHAIGLTIPLGDPQVAADLVTQLGKWRGEAIESRPALDLAQAAAPVIGKLRSPGAAQALMSALDDSAFPEIVSAAAIGLGELGAACPAEARTKLQALANSDSRAAASAKRAAAQCGR